MNAKRIEMTLGMMVLMLALAGVLTLITGPHGAAPGARLQPTGGEPAFSARELAEREALLHAQPTRREAERMRIETIARAEERSEREAHAIADAAMRGSHSAGSVAHR